MFIKRIDYISPSITFYYQGAHSHTSIFSGILSIISIIIILNFAGFYLYEFIIRKDLNAFYFKTFIDDSGTYPLNASSLFHFINIGESKNDYYWYEAVNFAKYRIIGLESYLINYINDRNISHFNHWLYGKCDNKTDTQGISHLINYEHFEKSACIKKYFDSSEQKYYDIEDPKFRWPVLSHGTIHYDNKFYCIIIEGCKEETINPILGENQKCINDTLIDIKTAYLYFINHYVDVLKYKNPTIKFLERIENGINKVDYFVNNLNIFPSIVRTHNGYFFDNIEEEKAYIYERNDVVTDINKGDEIYIGYLFWLKNTVNEYDRSYKRIQDVAPKIGGIYQVVIFISVFINSLYNQFIELNDTEALLFSSIKIKNKEHKKSPIDNKNKDNKFEELNKEKKNGLIKKSFNREKKLEKLDKNLEQNKFDNNNSKSRNNFIINSEELNHNSSIRIRGNEDKDHRYKNNNNINDKGSKITEKMIKEKKTFLKFIIFNLFCGKKYKWFEIYKNFRTKIISEEHLIKNYLNIYNLLRATENKKRFRRKSYRLKDFINLV